MEVAVPWSYSMTAPKSLPPITNLSWYAKAMPMGKLCVIGCLNVFMWSNWGKLYWLLPWIKSAMITDLPSSEMDKLPLMSSYNQLYKWIRDSVTHILVSICRVHSNSHGSIWKQALTFVSWLYHNVRILAVGSTYISWLSRYARSKRSPLSRNWTERHLECWGGGATGNCLMMADDLFGHQSQSSHSEESSPLSPMHHINAVPSPAVAT